jgi:hypothetical protein
MHVILNLRYCKYLLQCFCNSSVSQVPLQLTCNSISEILQSSNMHFKIIAIVVAVKILMSVRPVKFVANDILLPL